MSPFEPTPAPRAGFLRDALSGAQVFLIALPLCLGIALASGFPPIAGVLTAIVGGVVVSHLGSAPLTIKGPAAGLIVIALGAVTDLGQGDPVAGYRRALAVGVVAALLQVGLALLRAGALAVVMPPSVVHGMLAAIGVIIVVKQVPVLVGAPAGGGEPLEMLLHLPHTLAESNPVLLGIGLVSLAVVLGWPKIPSKLTRAIPAPMVVLVVAVPLGLAAGLGESQVYHFGGHAYELGPATLVRLPGDLLQAIVFPDFSVITSGTSLKYVLMFALVGSVESLLSVLAVDALDPEKRSSDLDRDLLVTGLGNLVSSLIGGLPMISEIVRSKANLDAGATSRWSNFFHGFYLLAFVALLPGVLELIPLAALAAMLVVVGLRLASPREFVHSWHLGSDQLALFLTTLLVTLATDLLVGVGVGIALKLVLHLARGASPRDLWRNPARIERQGDELFVWLEGPVVFTNLLGLVRTLQGSVDDSVHAVHMDFSRATHVDHTVLQKVQGLAVEWPEASLDLRSLENLRPASSHELSFRRRARGA